MKIKKQNDKKNKKKNEMKNNMKNIMKIIQKSYKFFTIILTIAKIFKIIYSMLS